MSAEIGQLLDWAIRERIDGILVSRSPAERDYLPV